MKKCTKCHKLKLLSDFTPNKLYKDGLTYWCKLCISRYSKLKYHLDPSFAKRLNKNNIIWQKKNKDKIRYNLLKLAYKYKTKAINHYSNGTNSCSCCGEQHIEFLSINHINGGGNQHRKKVNKSGWLFLKWLIDNDYPKGYNVLCHNCNQADGNFGGCPHKGDTIYTPFKA